jgi:1,4-dihydroxy-2-naphthoate octaprenyltransferase
MGLLSANILLVNNYRDMETDAAAGKKTLVVRLGRRFARAQFAVSMVVAFAIAVAFAATGYGLGCLLPLVLVPVAVAHVRRLTPAGTPPQLVALLGDTAKLMAAYAVLFAAGILI